MNRREIIKLFALAPLAASGFASLLVADDEYNLDQEFERAIKRTLERPPYTMMRTFSAQGCADISRLATISISRPQVAMPLLKFGINAFGQMLYWNSGVNGPIVFPDIDALPIVRCDDPDVKWYLPLDTPRGGALLSSDYPGLIMLEAA